MPTEESNDYVIIRTKNAGAFAGELVSVHETFANLENARRLWYWAGAASLSELAVRGTSRPSDCKFPVAVPRIGLTEVIEIIKTSPEGEKSIREVPEWSAHK